MTEQLCELLLPSNGFFIKLSIKFTSMTFLTAFPLLFFLKGNSHTNLFSHKIHHDNEGCEILKKSFIFNYTHGMINGERTELQHSH